MLASTRERRGNAGAKMATLLNQEDEGDDFYKTKYGGFFDETNDKAYISPVDSDGDSFDSDFDMSEAEDEPISDEDPLKPKRQKRMVTGVYKEPIRRGAGEVAKPRIRKSAGGNESQQSQKSHLSLDRKFRSSTLQKSERSFKDKLTKKHSKIGHPRCKEPQMTQEDRLKEAVKTEDLNLKALARWEEYEAEQKAKRERMLKKRGVVIGPRVKTISVAKLGDNSIREAHQYIVFSDEIAAKPYFPNKTNHIKLPIRKLCPVTGLPAKYVDPLTNTPYSNAKAYKSIRNSYVNYVRQRGDLKDPMVSKWMKQFF